MSLNSTVLKHLGWRDEQAERSQGIGNDSAEKMAKDDDFEYDRKKKLKKIKGQELYNSDGGEVQKPKKKSEFE